MSEELNSCLYQLAKLFYYIPFHLVTAPKNLSMTLSEDLTVFRDKKDCEQDRIKLWKPVHTAKPASVAAGAHWGGEHCPPHLGLLPGGTRCPGSPDIISKLSKCTIPDEM